MHTFFRLRGHGRRARILAPFALASAGALLVSSNAPANDRFTAGQAGTTSTALPAAAGRVIATRAAIDAALLGLPPGATRTAIQVDNRFLGRSYVDVTARDTNQHPVAMLRYNPDGSIRTAIQLSWHTSSTALPVARAETTARWFAVRAQATPVGVATVSATADGGTSVQWGRLVGGVPVPGDGVRVVLWPDGTLHSLAREQRPLATAPAAPLERAGATGRLEARLRDWFGASRPLVRVASLEFAWVAPIDMFNSQAADAPGSTLRLAWVATLSSSGALTSQWQRLQVWIDAGDGSLIGGDISR